jgi:hypothetical protein
VKKLTIIMVACALLLCGKAFATVPIYTETFSYPTGWLTDVSGGVWDTWLGTSQDAIVLSQMLMMDGVGVPEVCSYFPNALPGEHEMYAAFDFFVHEEGTTDTDSYFMIGGGTEATAEIDYNLWGFIIDWGADAPGDTRLHLWDLDGGGDDYGVAELALGLAVDTWHTVEVFAVQTVADPTANDPGEADGQFEVYLNGIQVMGPTLFVNNGANGVNSVDIYMFDDGEEHDFIAYDNIIIESTIPEPGTMTLIGAGLLGLLALRRRKN